MMGYHTAPQQTDHNLNLKWLENYIQQNFKQAIGLML